MSLEKLTYVHGQTVIPAENLNAIQDAIIELEKIDREAFEIVNVTGDIDSGYTADKTGVELVAAANAGKQLLCIVNSAIRLQAVWVDNGPPEAVWFSGNFGGELSTVTVHTEGTVTITTGQVGDTLPTGGKAGQVLTSNGDNTVKWDAFETTSISAKRFEAGENENVSALDPRGGIELTIMKSGTDANGEAVNEMYQEIVFDGYDGATVHGLSMYTFAPGSNNVSGTLPLSTVAIPDGRALQNGDFLLTTDGKIYKVTTVYVDGSGFKVALYTTIATADSVNGAITTALNTEV